MTPRQHVAILSPHLDDAVLSCWSLLTAPGDVTVVNVCTATPPAGTPPAFWDLLSGGRDPARRMHERRLEDVAALVLAGRTAHDLGFLDFQYAGSTPAATDIADRILATVSLQTLLYVPLGLGAHPDHLVARAAGLELQQRGCALAFYADLPHAVRPGWIARVADLPRHAGLALPQLAPSKRRLGDRACAAKLRAVGEYETQLAPLEGMLGGPVACSEVLRTEVMWAAPEPPVSRARRGPPNGSARAVAQVAAKPRTCR